MYKLLKFYKSIIHGVGLVPLLLTILLTSIALAFTLLPSLQSLDSYTTAGGYFEVRTPETARTILASLLAAVISITVFGFSMMMVVVNQASSNYSPKVVETLSSQRSNQYILGIYLGSVVFTLIIMMHIDSKPSSPGIPQTGLLLNMLLVVYCILLFVRFINNISKAVRITSITESIFKKTKRSIVKNKMQEFGSPDVKMDDWTINQACHSGHFQLLRTSKLLKLLKKHNLVIKVIPKVGTYYLDESPLFASNRKVAPEILDEIRSAFVTYSGEDISENPMYGIRQLREVAVKALSPGINDPGVAILCIDYITELLSVWMKRMTGDSFKDSDGNVRVIMNHFSFPEMLELSLVPIEVYSKRDYTMLISLLNSLHNLAMSDYKKSWKDLFTSYADSIISDAKDEINNKLERDAINTAITKLNTTGYFSLSLLKLNSTSSNGSFK
jgi:uncharacterized membrane protein